MYSVEVYYQGEPDEKIDRAIERAAGRLGELGFWLVPPYETEWRFEVGSRKEALTLARKVKALKMSVPVDATIAYTGADLAIDTPQVMAANMARRSRTTTGQKI